MGGTGKPKRVALLEPNYPLGNSDAPMNIIATMNAGYIPPEVWVHDIEVGGGRIIGEALSLY